MRLPVSIFLALTLSAAVAAPVDSAGRLARLDPGFQENPFAEHSDVLFSARDHRGTMEITRTGVRFAVPAGKDRVEVIRMEFAGAKWSNPAGEEPSAAEVHYLVGADRNRWKSGVRTYRAVRVREAYPGIDIVFHTRRGSVEFDYEVRPGADPKRARVRFPENRLELLANGDLRVRAGDAGLTLPKPVAFQNKGETVPARFIRKGAHEAGIAVGNYDRTRPLTIDPAIAYLSYLGGSGVDSGVAFAVDGAGNMYVGGSTASSNFPLGRTPVQNTLRGTLDAFISKFGPDGTLLHSTLLGGTGTDALNGIAVDSQGSVYFCGGSNSENFPTASPIQSTNKGSLDVVFGKLNPAGSALVYSSYYGGQYSDNGLGCVIDGQNNLYVTGRSFSDNFPVTPGSFQTSNRSPIGNNGFVTKIDPQGGAVFSTYIGGGGDETLFGIALDRSNNIVVVGSSEAIINPPYPTLGAFQATRRSAIDAVVTKLNAAGTNLIWSTFLGGPQADIASAVAVDNDGNVYVGGVTAGSGFPVGANALRREVGGPSDAFAVKLSASGNELVWGTLFGGNNSEQVTQGAVDSAGAFYVTGWTESTGITAVDAVQPNFGGGARDGFLTKFSPRGDAIQMMTYLGGNGEDFGWHVRLDNTGRVYALGTTTSTNLPTTSNGNQKAAGGAGDTFVTVIDSSTAANPFTLSTTRLTFTGAPGAAVAAQQFQIRATAGAPAWTIDAATLRGGTWLSATPRTGTGSATIDVRVDTTGLAAGNYEGTLTVNNTRLGTRTVVAVILTVGEPAGAVPDNGVVSAATFRGGAYSPGMLVTIFGTRIGPPAATTAQLTAQNTLATTLAETRVLFDGVAAPLVFVSANQVSAIVPYETAGKASTAMQVEYRGVRSNAVALRVADAAPGLFTANSSGRGQGAILNQDASFNSASNPAEKGSVVVLYGTGEGVTDPAGQNGLIASSVFPKPRQPVTVRIGGKDAEVLYAGAAPSLVAGVFQVNVKIPDDVESGDQPVVVQIGTVSSAAEVTVAVR